MSEVGFLADTHVLIWHVTGDPRLSSKHKALIDSAAPLFVSSVSVLEVSIKRALGKLKTPPSMFHDFAEAGIVALPITWHHASAVEKLPLHHRDPFDRTLIAQAKIEGLTLMTTDPQIRKYDVDVC